MGSNPTASVQSSSSMAEHRLYKAGVVGSSPTSTTINVLCAGGEMVDTQVLGTCAERREGSSPSPRTKKFPSL